jgi:hypothetical protein
MSPNWQVIYFRTMSVQLGLNFLLCLFWHFLLFLVPRVILRCFFYIVPVLSCVAKSGSISYFSISV